MKRILIWLNLYGCEAVRNKLKNRQKCPLHQSILPIHEIFSNFKNWLFWQVSWLASLVKILTQSKYYAPVCSLTTLYVYFQNFMNQSKTSIRMCISKDNKPKRPQAYSMCHFLLSQGWISCVGFSRNGKKIMDYI